MCVCVCVCVCVCACVRECVLGRGVAELLRLALRHHEDRRRAIGEVRRVRSSHLCASHAGVPCVPCARASTVPCGLTNAGLSVRSFSIDDSARQPLSVVIASNLGGAPTARSSSLSSFCDQAQFHTLLRREMGVKIGFVTLGLPFVLHTNDWLKGPQHKGTVQAGRA